MDIKILVATHKKYWMPKDDLYLPIHVGKSTGRDIGIIGDNTGANISSKNQNYCELTGLYWAWKNLNNDYLGLVHYRRYFTSKNVILKNLVGKKNSIINRCDIEELLDKYDVILPKKRSYFIETNFSHYSHAHNGKDLLKAGKIIKKYYPQYYKAFEHTLNRTSAHMFNMFIMKKEYFFKYCKWIFSILEKLESCIDISHYNVQESRVYGYISEILLDVWIETNHIKYKELEVVFLENEHWVSKIKNFLIRKFTSNY